MANFWAIFFAIFWQFFWQFFDNWGHVLVNVNHLLTVINSGFNFLIYWSFCCRKNSWNKFMWTSDEFVKWEFFSLSYFSGAMYILVNINHVLTIINSAFNFLANFGAFFWAIFWQFFGNFFDNFFDKFSSLFSVGPRIS